MESLQRVDEALGREVLTAFCRCFVHADRLNSTMSCMDASAKHHGGNSIAYARDLNAMVWFSVGTLRELAHSIQSLRRALDERGLHDPESAPWVVLSALENRWQFYKKMRDTVAFHVDAEVVSKGLDKVITEPNVMVCEGEGQKNVKSRLTLGYLALHNGVEWDLREALEIVRDDHLQAGPAIQKAFARAAKQAGVPVQEMS